MQRRFTGYSTYKRQRQRGALAVQLMVLTLALIGGAGYFVTNNVDQESGITNLEATDGKLETISQPKANLDQTLELRDVNGGATQARFTRKIAEYSSSFSVIGELPKSPVGHYYEVWAVEPDPYKFMSLGQMVERTDGKYGLVFESKDDLRGFSDIIITLEKDDKNPAPSAHVLEGKF